MSRIARYMPEGLMARFVLLLAAALVAANLVALGLLSFERLRLGRDAMEAREVERVVSLVPAIEAVAPRTRERIARKASTRFSRVSIDLAPVVQDAPATSRSKALTKTLAEALPGRGVRAAVMVRRSEREGGPRIARQSVAVSVRLPAEAGQGQQWLNLVSRGPSPRGPGIDDEVFLVVLGLSLVSVLAVGWLFLRHLTRPLEDLTAATRAAGRGDRGVRVAEDGARELRELAAAFNDMQARIERFDAERMRTLAAVGHDLRTPITSLRIRAEMLDEDMAAPIIRTLDDMAVMAEGLVTYARGTGEVEPPRRIELSKLLADLIETRSGTLERSEPVTVTARPVALKRALGNLLDNAVRYGGTARLSLARAGGAAVISIEDDGPGIAPDRIEAMFQPFQRGETSRNSETGGAGLGLSIARTIINAHGGDIELANRPEGGLVARVTLPLGSIPRESFPPATG